MNCKNCGKELPAGASVCPECGSAVQAPNATPILVWGIVALALALSTGIGGLICAIIAKKKIKEYEAAGGELTGMAKVGNILTKIALPVSIVMIVVYVLSFSVGVISGIVAALSMK